MRKLQNDKTKPIHVAAVFPMDLYERLIRQVAKETHDRKKRVTPSEIIRWAVEEYLDSWETATFVPDGEAAAAVADEKGGA